MFDLEITISEKNVIGKDTLSRVSIKFESYLELDLPGISGGNFLCHYKIDAQFRGIQAIVSLKSW